MLLLQLDNQATRFSSDIWNKETKLWQESPIQTLVNILYLYQPSQGNLKVFWLIVLSFHLPFQLICRFPGNFTECFCRGASYLDPLMGKPTSCLGCTQLSLSKQSDIHMNCEEKYSILPLC